MPDLAKRHQHAPDQKRLTALCRKHVLTTDSAVLPEPYFPFTPARVTHIMNLLLLAPEIQERLLFLPRAESGKEVCLKDLQEVAREWRWERQLTTMHIGKRSLLTC